MAGVMTRNAPIEYYSRGLREKLRLDALKLNPPAIGPDQVYADIEYKINENKYDARTQARIRAGGLETSLPIGWPKALDGPLIWIGADLEDEGQYVLRLGDAEKAELVTALRHYKGSEPAPPTGTIDTDILLDQGLTAIRLVGRIFHSRISAADWTQRPMISNKQGVCDLRGLGPDSFSAEDFTITYLGISSSIAEKRGKQDQRGSMLSKAYPTALKPTLVANV